LIQINVRREMVNHIKLNIIITFTVEVPMRAFHASLAAVGLALSLSLALPAAAADNGASGYPGGGSGLMGGPGYGYGPMMGYGNGLHGPGQMPGWGPGRGMGPWMMGYGEGPGYFMGSWMMGGMWGYSDADTGVDFVEGRLAFIKTELKITDKEMPLWNAFAEAVRANAKTINERVHPFFT
jgi:hypothetical protein